ncbi:MAG: hypothetical protein QXZ44_02780 [Ferroplasma sp.]
MTSGDDVIKWMQDASGKTSSLVDLQWKISKEGDYTVLQNDQIPFALLMLFDNDKDTINLIVRTGIETATIENQPRLSIYRTLLILNQKIELVKFMLDGINEEVVAREDVPLSTLTRDQLNVCLNTILASFYLLVKALNLEDQFNSKIIERTEMIVKEMAEAGKSRDDIKNYLVTQVGLSPSDSDKLISEILDAGAPPKSMYE